MTNLHASGLLVARILLSFMFITSGFAKLGDVSGTMAYVESGGLPGVFAYPAVVLEILGGIAILVGWQTTIAAVALAGFSAVAAVLYHYVPAQGLAGMEAAAQMTNFNKNLAIAGGFLALAAAGAGAWSLDARLGQERQLASA